MTETLIEKAIKPALDAVEKHWRGERSAGQKDVNDKESGKGALIIVGRRDQDKFFSNGLLPPAILLPTMLTGHLVYQALTLRMQ